MNDFYVIVGISPNPVTNDHISVGLVAWTQGRFECKIAWSKIKDSSKLFSTSRVNIEWPLKQLISKLAESNAKLNMTQAELFYPQPHLDRGFFDYLNRYQNGIIRFLEPQRLTQPLKGLDFDNLFRALISREEKEEAIEVSHKVQASSLEFRKNVLTKIIHPLSETVHTKYTFSPHSFSELYFNIEVDCIGKNGAIYAAKSFDFEHTSAPTLDKHLGHYTILSNVLNETYNPQRGEHSFFIIGDEPSDIQSEVHKQWEAIYNMKWVQLVPSENAQVIAHRILEAQATKFLP